MGWRDMTAEEAEEIGREVYQEKVRPTLKGAEEPIGYFLAVDHDSMDWELDEYHHKAVRRLRGRHPAADVYTFKVGFPAAYESFSLLSS